MQRGERVVLLEDYIDAEREQSFKAGQRGTFQSKLGRLAIVEFDGYEAERARAAEMRARLGVGPNIAPWLGLVPPAKLRAGA